MIKKVLVAGVVGYVFFLNTGVVTAQKPEPTEVYTTAQAKAGKIVFEERVPTRFSNRACSDCHGATLAGKDGSPNVPPPSSPSADTPKAMTDGGAVAPLAGSKFMAKWASLTTDKLSDRIKFAFGKDPLRCGQECLDITAYVLQFNGAKPGTQALTADTAVEIRSIASGVAPQTTTAAPDANSDSHH
jgi:hypothetical protein